MHDPSIGSQLDAALSALGPTREEQARRIGTTTRQIARWVREPPRALRKLVAAGVLHIATPAQVTPDQPQDKAA